MSDWAKLKVVDLKAELKNRDLPQNGLKAELVARLEEADQSQAQQDPVVEDDDAKDEDQGQAEPEVADAAQQQNGDAPAPTAVEEEHKSETLQDDAPIERDLPDEKPSEPAPEPQSLPVEPIPEPVPQADPAPETAPQPEPEQIEAEEKPLSPKPDANDEDDMMAIDVPAADLQKRKRRSQSPPPDEEGVAKRARIAEDPPMEDVAPAVHIDSDEPPKNEHEDDKMEDVQETSTAAPIEPPAPQTIEPADDAEHIPDYGRPVAPALHYQTPALYVSNLMRPLRPADIQAHLVDLATPRGQTLRNDIITLFHLDQMRTHAFVIFTTPAAAARVRAQLHDTVWPNESNRKALWLDFIPPEKVQGWIDTETSGGRGRWEIVYTDASDGPVEARLEAATGSLSRAPPSAPTGPRADSINTFPLGPRGGGPQAPPTGPRAKRSGPGPRPALGGKWTTAGPSISFTAATEDVVQRRLASMHSHYTARRGPYGRDINRYSFEQGDVFVDRGKEVFEGIRPPHRERGGRGGRGGGGGGGRGRRPWPRPSGDRYMPQGASNFRFEDRR